MNPETKKFLLTHLNLCLGEPTFWQRHQSKIIGAIIGLVVIAAITVPPLLIFGLPVIIAAVGGAVLFGCIVAIGSGMGISIGSLIGNILDDQRMSLHIKLTNWTEYDSAGKDSPRDYSASSASTSSEEPIHSDSVVSQPQKQNQNEDQPNPSLTTSSSPSNNEPKPH